MVRVLACVFEQHNLWLVLVAAGICVCACAGVFFILGGLGHGAKGRRRWLFVAGLSAGGAMAMVMAETYPDVFGAVGIHSGLDYQSASDVASAFAAMRGSRSPQVVSPTSGEFGVRTIVFHGASDLTVHPSNADRISARLRLSAAPHTISNTQRCDGSRWPTFRMTCWASATN